jgi:hypothetical protein
VFKKQAQLSQDDDESQVGDQYVFTAMDSETKLMIVRAGGKEQQFGRFNEQQAARLL